MAFIPRFVSVVALVTLVLAGCGGGGGGSSPPSRPQSATSSSSATPGPSSLPLSGSSSPLTSASAPAQASSGPARYVDPSHSNAQDSGAGTASQPWKTLGYAMKQLKPGDTLNIAAGTYRESLNFPQTGWGGARTVIQTARAGTVTIKGSDVVTGWQSRGNGIFVKQPWTVNSQQVFVDGASLKQIGGTIFNGYPDRADHPLKALHAGGGGVWPGRTPGGVAQLTPNSFHYDEGSKSLYIKVPFGSLAGHTVEASVRTYVAHGRDISNVTFRNLRFQHSNTTAVNYSGAVTLIGNGLVLDAVDIARADGNGLDMIGDNNVIRNSRANYCGQVGMKVRGANNRLTNNETNYNNARGFNKWWEAGGAKFVGNGGLRDSEVTGHRAIGNAGDGIWFDWLNTNNRIHKNVAAYNTGFGIHYEASQKGYIYDNYVFGNGQRGIFLPHSAESVVAHNIVVRNGLEGIVIIDEGRGPEMSQLRPRSGKVFGNIVAWNGKAAIVLPPGLLGTTSDYNLILTGRTPATFSAGWAPLRTGLGEWRSASGQDTNSWTEYLETPADLAAAIQAKDGNPNWGALKSVAAKYRVPTTGGPAQAQTAGVQYSPGPRG